MLRGTAVVLALVAAAWVAGCGQNAERPAVSAVATERAPEHPAGVPPPKAVARPRIVMLGDSLTAGLGLSSDQAYPALLQQRLDASGFKYEVVNAGVSGDTSAGGLSRLDWALEGDVRLLVVALGGNDALRALPAEELKQNLSHIIERAQARHIAVVLAGMEAPRNFGRDYIVAFHQVYPSLARQYHVALVPFLLEGVAMDPALMQPDGLHPNPAGEPKVLENVWPVLALELKTRR